MIQGVDTSHWQGATNYSNLKTAGKEFCFAKATEGILVRDNQFARSRQEAPKAGLLFGAYHFFHPKLDVDQQVEHFKTIMGPARSGELFPALDFETTDNIGMGRAMILAKALHFITAIGAAYSCTPFIYGSSSFLRSYSSPDFAKFPLWVANYGVHAPRIPAPWHNYTIWQYSDAHGIDLDVFNGGMDQLKKFTFA